MVVLAAGQGSRFGGNHNKLLVPCTGRDGLIRPVLGHVLHNLAGLQVRRIVVTRPGQPCVTELALAQGCEILEIASHGMGDTLAAAVRYAGPGFHWMIVLGDMPFILPETLRLLAECSKTMDALAVCAPACDGRLGHPVIFAEGFFMQLTALEGDQGGRSLFGGAQLMRLETTDQGIHHDVDTPQALVFT